jgi:4-alpha-glucanotransferase
MFTTSFFAWIQDASEALFLRSAFNNVIFSATENDKRGPQSVSINKSLDPEGIIYSGNQLSDGD